METYQHLKILKILIVACHVALFSMEDVDLQDEDTGKTIMFVDQRNVKQTVIFGALSWAMIFACFITLPRDARVVTQELIVENTGLGISTPLLVENVSPYHLFLMVEMLVTRRNPLGTESLADLSVKVYSPHNSTVEVFSSSRQHQFVFDGIVSKPKVIFYDKLLFRSSYLVQVDVRTQNITEFERATMRLKLADPVSTWSLIFNRFYVSVVMVVIILYFLFHRRFKLKAKLVPTPEQYLTAFLVVGCAVADNPFDFLCFKRPSMFFVGLRVVCNVIFTYFARYYITALFDSIRCRRKWVRNWEYCLTVTSFVILAISDCLASLWQEVKIAHTRLTDMDPAVLGIKYLCVLLGNLFVIGYVWMALTSLDETEGFRFWCYLLHSAVFVLISATASIIRLVNPQTEVLFSLLTVDLFSNTVFVIVMCGLHWPYPKKNEYNETDANGIQEIELDENLRAAAEDPDSEPESASENCQ